MASNIALPRAINLKIEKLDAAEGDSVNSTKSCWSARASNVKIGEPLGVRQQGQGQESFKQAKDRKKIDVIKFKRRQNYRRTHGHRQPFTLVEITGITGGPRKKACGSRKRLKRSNSHGT